MKDGESREERLIWFRNSRTAKDGAGWNWKVQVYRLWIGHSKACVVV